MDSAFYILKIVFDFLDESTGILLSPKCLADRVDGGPDILQSVDLDGKGSDLVFSAKPGEGFILPLDNQEIRLERSDLLFVRVDQSTYPRDKPDFRRVRAEIADTHDSLANSERENDFGHARSGTDDPLRFDCCPTRLRW